MRDQHRSPSRRAAIALFAAAGVAWAGAALAAPVTVRGDVQYRERMALPPGARVVVTLSDVSRADAAARVIATTSAAARGGPPLPFVLRFDDRRLSPRASYALQARITDAQGRLLFINTERHPWRPGERSATILTRRAGGDVGPQAGRPHGPRIGVHGAWLAEDILGAGVIDRARTRLEIAPNGQATGSGGCNRFTGQARINPPRIAFGRMASTQMACPPALMQQEQRFHRALGQARSFRIEQETRRLLLLDGRNRVVMRLAAD